MLVEEKAPELEGTCLEQRTLFLCHLPHLRFLKLYKDSCLVQPRFGAAFMPALGSLQIASTVWPVI